MAAGVDGALVTAPVLSLCLPTLDRGELFTRTLRSLSAQTFSQLEIIVVDNASKTDEAARAVASLADGRVRYLRQPARVPMGENWNRAVAEARGEFVAVCHDDDVYDPGFATETVARLQADPSLAFVHTAALHVDEHGAALGLCDHGWPERVSGRDFRRRTALFPRRSLVEAQTVVARRSAHLEAGPFIGDWIQATDADMWLRLAERGAVAFVRRPVVTVRLRTAKLLPSARHVAALRECTAVARRAARVLSAPERLLARARLDAVVLESLAWILARGDATLGREVRDEVLAQLSTPARLFARAALRGGDGEALRRLVVRLADARLRWRARRPA